MRPLAFAGILAVLAGCSMPYEGKSFAAMPKPHHMAEGESHEINTHGAEEEGSKSQGDALSETAAHHEPNGGIAVYQPDASSNLPIATDATTSPSAAVFPSTVKPTGKAPVIESAHSEAGPASEPAHGE